MLLKRELARTHAALKLEEERNRGLPELPVIQTPEEYQRRANEAVTRYLGFLDRKKLYPMRANMDPALRAQLGEYVPLETRNFFAIATHYEPLTLYTHFYHWWDLARMRDEPHPSPIRRGPLLYNIWDSRSEGMATAMEEFMLNAGLFDDEPRAREIVWIMLAQRAARGLASLYAHANIFDLQQAKAFQVEWTPRGWMRPDLDLLGFEQQLYLRQPGYGTSYVTGKHLLEDLVRLRAQQLGKDFSMYRYFDEVNAAGMIPVPMIRWQMLGTGGRTMKTLTILAALAFAAAAGADTTLDYNVLHAGKKSGAQKTVIQGDGKIHVSYSYRDNGRGPDIEEDIALLPDGTFRSYRQTGKTTYGAKLDERFSISGKRASWQSPAERGSQALTAPAVYLPSYGSPETSAVIVRATQKAGGRLAALPGGELSSERLATTRVGAAGRRARGRALRDPGRRPAAGLRLAGKRRRHAPLRQHQCRRQPHGRRRLRGRDAGARAPAAAGGDEIPRGPRREAHAGAAAADPDQERAGLRREVEGPRRAGRRLRQRRPHRGDLSGGLARERPRPRSSTAPAARCCRACLTCTRTRTPGTRPCRSRAASPARATWATTTTTWRA